MQGIAPLASSHFTHNKHWVEISNRVAYGLKMLTSPQIDPQTRENIKRRVRRQIEVQAAFRLNAQFDTQTDDIVAMRRHALASSPKASPLKKMMN